MAGRTPHLSGRLLHAWQALDTYEGSACGGYTYDHMWQALDTFNTALVSSTYYVFFTTCTIAASMIMYREWESQTVGSITTQCIGFGMLVLGIYILTATRRV